MLADGETVACALRSEGTIACWDERDGEGRVPEPAGVTHVGA